MSNMTWNEFKDLIDKELDKFKVNHDVEIWYIDISFPSNIEDDYQRPTAFVDEKCGLAID